jgi:transcriptional regulator with XRE-family HTH domain
MHVEHETEPGAATLEVKVGRELQRLRNALRWSQKEAARRISVSPGYESWHQTTIARIEAAKRPLRLNEAAALAALYGVSVEQLLAAAAGAGLDAKQLNRQIAETEAALKEAERAYDKAINAFRNADTERAWTETQEREAFGQMTFYRATLNALRSAQEQQEEEDG